MTRGARVLIAAALASLLGAGPGRAAADSHTAVLEGVRAQINAIEKDLLEGRSAQLSATGQLRKIKKLLALQAREIQLSKKRVADLAASLNGLSSQERELLARIEKEKAALRLRLRELDGLAGTDALDASWLTDPDARDEKYYFLTKTLEKEMGAVQKLRADAVGAQTLEARVLEEKNKLDYNVQELDSQMAMLSANEIVQKEIIRTRRADRLESLQKIRNLRESERDLEKVLAGFREQQKLKVAAEALAAAARAQPKTSAVHKEKPAELAAAQPVDIQGMTLAALKGSLPLPVEGHVASAFGRSYNRKTNLLTFQKGITIQAGKSALVRAVSAGKVVFAGPLRNYGLIAIVEHPGQYYTLYGQMGAVAVKEGATVSQGEMLGKTDGEPLYFEIRSRNVAVNPSQWLKL